ncbi:hypothetical protein [Streptacidiphilus fuscans]|uniref:Secreted protein n=1 Tax=Streptacidiphilus fuscans TaxID=2789292 RepID=A0A931B7X9_9ACTN|nr:hypothetical protein [Streptacidiphilus fuscans]MBF9071786.1 hypothetical protein [Streptacidiphilus fuscans]
MRISRTRAAVIAATLTAATALGVVPASAAANSTVSGCFAADWNPGWLTTTVFWHNRCSTRHKLEVIWDGPGYSNTVRLVNGYAKGSTWTTSDNVIAVYDLGRA